MFDPNRTGVFQPYRPNKNWKVLCLWAVGMICVVGMLVFLLNR